MQENGDTHKFPTIRRLGVILHVYSGVRHKHVQLGIQKSLSSKPVRKCSHAIERAEIERPGHNTSVILGILV